MAPRPRTMTSNIKIIPHGDLAIEPRMARSDLLRQALAACGGPGASGATMRPMAHQESAHRMAINAPDPSATNHPKYFTSIGTREVEAIPPTIPAAFMMPDTAPTFCVDRCAAVVQKEDSAKYRNPTLRHRILTARFLLPTSAAANNMIPKMP